jgi:hypothetical protein
LGTSHSPDKPAWNFLLGASGKRPERASVAVGGEIPPRRLREEEPESNVVSANENKYTCPGGNFGSRKRLPRDRPGFFGKKDLNSCGRRWNRSARWTTMVTRHTVFRTSYSGVHCCVETREYPGTNESGSYVHSPIWKAAKLNKSQVPKLTVNLFYFACAIGIFALRESFHSVSRRSHRRHRCRCILERDEKRFRIAAILGL